MGGNDRMAMGSVCHVEIPAPDLAALRGFYGGVFGWTFSEMGPQYVLFHAGDGGGGLDASAPVVDGGVVLVLAVEDIDASLTAITGAGGEALSPKTGIGGDHGFCAYFRDPCGNKMGIWSRS